LLQVGMAAVLVHAGHHVLGPVRGRTRLVSRRLQWMYPWCAVSTITDTQQQHTIRFAAGSVSAKGVFRFAAGSVSAKGVFHGFSDHADIQ
jgi:hypothetical protein